MEDMAIIAQLIDDNPFRSPLFSPRAALLDNPRQEAPLKARLSSVNHPPVRAVNDFIGLWLIWGAKSFWNT